MHRRQEHALQVAAVDRELRRLVAGPAAGGLGVDELAEAIEERRLARRHRDPLQRFEHAESMELGGGMRQDVDADAERPDLSRLLVDAAGDAGAVQAEGERQPADAGAEDGDPLRFHRCLRCQVALNISMQRDVVVRPGMSWTRLALRIRPFLSATSFSEQVRSSRP